MGAGVDLTRSCWALVLSMVYAASVALFGEFLGRLSGLPDWPDWKRPELAWSGTCSDAVTSGGLACSCACSVVSFACSCVRDLPMFIGVPPDTTGEMRFSGELASAGGVLRVGFFVFIFNLILG